MKLLYLFFVTITTYIVTGTFFHRETYFNLEKIQEVDKFGIEFQKNCIKKVSEYLKFNKLDTGGIIVIENNQGIQTRYTWGRYSTEDSEEVRETTPYDLASISKLYLIYCILKLHEEKKINIYDYCKKYLPNFGNSNLRIIDLLTHMANFNISLADYRKKYTNVDDLKEKILQIEAPIFKSEEVAYQNTTYLFLQEIIEKVTNNSLENIYTDFFRKNNLNKTYLGLKDQKLFQSPPTEIVDGVTIKNITHDETARLFGGITGHAGIFATAPDLIKFAKLWLKNDTLKELAFQNYNLTGKLSQGLGWWGRIPDNPTNQTPSLNTPGIYSHTGFTGGILFIHLPSGSICSMLTNNRTYPNRNKLNQNQRFIWEILINEFLNQN